MSLNDGLLGANYSPVTSGNVHYVFANNAAFPGLMQLHAEVNASPVAAGHYDTNVNISMPAENKILASGTVIRVDEGAQYWSSDTGTAYPLPDVELYSTVTSGVPASGLSVPAYPYAYQNNQNVTN